MELTNVKVAELLRQVAAAYTIKKVGNIFQIRAYENAATSIEHATSEIKDLFEEGKLDDIPGIGESIKDYLEELFKTGKVKHWEEVKKGIPEQVFDFLNIPGIGPKTAQELAKLGVKDVKDLQDKLESGELVKKGFSEKIAPKILAGISEHQTVKTGRMMLPVAFAQAEKVLEYLKKCPHVLKADALGSLRRMVTTVGDLDFAVSSEKPQEVADHILTMPGIERVLDKGETKVSVLLNSGLQLDFIITLPDHFGALLQHFTGSKAHNIHLRTLAESKGLSLSEYGIRKLKTQNAKRKSETQNSKLIITKTEEEFYRVLGMDWIPPEIREDAGEIEVSLKHQLPNLIIHKDIKGDLHIHDNFPIEPSHDLGRSSLEEIIKTAKKLDYEYVGVSDHSPSVNNHNQDQIVKLITKRTQYMKESRTPGIRVLNLLEVDIQPDGSLSVPDEGLKLLDFAIASIHSSFRIPKEQMTKRILKALGNSRVKVLGHPTSRLINKRDSIDADWEAIFKFAAKNKIAMEINSFPDRLDLPDQLVRMAKELGVKFVIDTDSHEVGSMDNMLFGVAVARRGWLTTEEVINSWPYDRFAKWFEIR